MGRRKKYLSVVMILSTFLTFPILSDVFLQSPSIHHIQEGTRTATPAPTPTPTPIPSEIQVLNAQIELMKDYDRKLLDTVYWALGTSVIVILAAASAGWFANFRSYERDKETMRNELINLINTRTADQKKEIRNLIDSRMEKIVDQIPTIVERSLEPLLDQIVNANLKILVVEMSVYDQEAKYWRSLKVFGNELLAYIKMLDKAVEGEWHPRITISLDGIQEALNSGAEPSVYVIQRLTSVLDNLPSEYSVVADNIRSRLN